LIRRRTVKIVTIEFLRRLAECDWFHSVGEPLVGAFPRVVTSWEQAFELRYTDLVDDVWQEAGNHLSRVLARDHRSIFQGWNDVVREVTPHVSALVDERLYSRNVRAKLAPSMPLNFAELVTSDLRKCCIALEYAEYYRSDFHESIGAAYLSGHFPCGWDGERPGDFSTALVGEIVVF
jgi:hypothetical protein